MFTIFKTESEFNEFEPRLKSAKNRFQLSAGFNLEKLKQFKVEPTIFEPCLKFKPWLKFFKFGLWLLLNDVSLQNWLVHVQDYRNYTLLNLKNYNIIHTVDQIIVSWVLSSGKQSWIIRNIPRKSLFSQKKNRKKKCWF